jgi:DNA polymerase-3 subunit gamma/tau
VVIGALAAQSDRIMATQAQALYRRWRPQTFEDVIGQEHIARTLRNAVAGDRLAHAYLFTGPRGTGKTSVARILAKAINCTGDGAPPCNECAICLSMTAGRSLDLIEIDAASNTGVDDVRDLRDKISFAPNEATFKVYIIDEVHMLSTAAFNALLKTLEEPPPHAVFVLATTEPHKIPDTIASRCQRHDFRRVPLGAIVGKLERICESEGVDAEPAALEMVARSATGSMRDAESLLDQLRASGDDITVSHVRDVLGTPADAVVADLLDALVAADAAQGLQLINAAMDQGADARQFRGLILDHLRYLLLIQTGVDSNLLNVSDAQLERLTAQAERLPRRVLIASVHRFSDAMPTPDLTQPALPLELALVETVLGMEDAEQGERADPSAVARSARVAPARASSAKAPAAAASSAKVPAADPGSASTPAAMASSAMSPAAVASAGAASAEKSGESASKQTERAVGTAAGDSVREETEAGSRETGPGLSLDRVRKEWPAIIEIVKHADANTAAMLRDGRPVAIDGSSLTVGFFYEFHCKKVSEIKRSEQVASAASKVLGEPVKLRCTVVPANHDEADGRPRTVADQAKQDPVVKHAVEELGARIASVSKDRQD